MRNRILRITLGVIALFQVFFGAVFLVAPSAIIAAFGLEPVPAWAPWIFALFSARAFGFAVGMIVAMRDPRRHAAWIWTMVGVQAIDWMATVAFIASGALTIAQASTAAFMPIVFIVALLLTMPRRERTPAAA